MTRVISAEQKAISKRITGKKLKSLMASTALAAAGMILLSSEPASALPQGASVQGGSVSYDYSVADTLTATQTTDRAYSLWDTFDTSSGETVNIDMPGANSLSVNKVQGADIDGTQFDGILNSNGNVWILDQNGVFFGATAQIDVGGLLASTGDVSVADVMDGDGNFTFDNFGSGQVINNGTMNIAEAGLAAFVAPYAANRGVINAKLGTVAFAAGDAVTLDLYGDGLFEITAPSSMADALIENTGDINAEGGTVLMTADAAKEAVDNIINMNGVISVASVEVKGGKIVLSGGDKGTVKIAGKLDASGTDTGGSVDVKGQSVDIAETAELKADGDVAGDIFVIAKDRLRVAGRMRALGLNKTGFIETSANIVDIAGGASVLAGHWLVNPVNIVIDGSNEGAYETQLGAGDLTITTDQAGGDAGDLSLQVVLDWATANTLTLFANNNMTVTAAGGINATGGGDANLIANNFAINGTINADTVTFDRATLGNFGLNFNAGGAATLNGSELNNITANSLMIGRPDAGQNNIAQLDLQGTHDYSTHISGLVQLNALGGADSFVTAYGDHTFHTAEFNVNDGVTFTGDTTIATTVGAAVFDVDADDTGIVGGFDDFRAQGGDAVVNSAGDITIIGNGYNETAGGTLALNANGGAGSINFLRSTDGTIGIGNGASGGLHFDDGELSRMVAGTINFGNPVAAQSSTTEINVVNADLDHIDTVNLYALAASQIDFAGTNYFNVLNAATDLIRVMGGSVNATTSIHFDAPEVNLNGDLDAPLIGGTATMVNVQSNAATIQDGIDIAASGAGAVVTVDDGTYIEDVIIDKDDITVDSVNGAATTTVQTPDLSSPFRITGTDVTVDGFTVVGGLAGFMISGSTDATIQNNIIHSQIDFGIYGLGFSGADINNNVFDGNGLATDAIAFTNAVDTTISANTIREMRDNGINVIGDSDNVTIDDNDIFGEGDNIGVNINGGNDIAVTNNTIDDFETGVSIKNVTGTNSVSDNTITRVEYGVKADTVAGLTVAGNTISGNSVTGIEVTDSNGAVIDDNDLDHFVTGINVENSNGAQILNNTLTDISGTNIHVLGGLSVLADNNDISSGTTGIHFDNTTSAFADTNTIGGVSGDAIRSDNGSILTNAMRNIINGAGGYGIYIDSRAAGVKTNTIDNTGNDAIEISNSLGAQITDNIIGTNGGTDNIGGEGIDVNNSPHNTVSGNIITNTGDNGISLNPSSFSTISNNNITNADRFGITTTNSTNLTVSGNTISGTAADGIRSTNASDSSFSGNNVSDTQSRGIAVGTSDDVTIDGNQISDTESFGILLNIGSNASVTGNTVNDTSLDGIYLLNANGSTVDSNIVDNTGVDGIYVDTSEGIIISNNRIGTNSGAGNIGDEGIDVNNSAEAQITNNTVMNTVSNGISINPSPDSTISGNTITDADGHGILSTDSDDVTIEDNTVENAALDGIRVVDGEGADIYDNEIENTGGDGIHVEDGAGVDVAYNAILSTGGNGIDVSGSNEAEIYGNQLGLLLFDGFGIGPIGGHGIAVSGSEGVDIYENLVLLTAGNGIDVSDSTETYIDYNLVGLSAGNGINVSGSDYTAIEENFVFATLLNGINVTGGSYAYIAENNVLATGGDGIRADGVADGEDGFGVVIEGNDVALAGSNGIAILNSGATDITDNSVLLAGLGLADWLGDGFDLGDGFQLEDLDGLFATLESFVDLDAGTLTIPFADGDGIYVENVVAGESFEDSDYSVVIYDNYVSATGGDGIEVADSGRAQITENEVVTAGIDSITWDLGDFLGADLFELLEGFEDVIFGDAEMNETLLSFIPEPTGIVFNDHDGIHVENVTGGDEEEYSAEIAGNTVEEIGGDGIEVKNTAYAYVGDYNFIADTGANGIYINGSNNADVLDNEIEYAGLHGIKVNPSDYVHIENNDIYDSTVDGIYVEGGVEAEIVGNEIYNSGEDGIDVDNNEGVGVYENTIEENGANGIKVTNSPNAEIADNDIEDSVLDGIFLGGSHGSTVAYNDVYDSGEDGIHVSGSETLVEYNYVDGTGANGIFLNPGFDGYSDSSTVQYNEVYNTDGHGIYAYDTWSLTVFDNIVESTVGDGIRVELGNGTVIEANSVLETNGRGIYVSTDGSSADILDNDIGETGGNGIEITNASNSLIEDNDVYGTGSNGIKVNDSADVSVTDNYVEETDDDGIDADNASGILIAGNDVYYSGEDGIDVEDSENATIEENYIYDTEENGIELQNSNSSSIVDNEVEYVGENGIYVNPSDNVSITGNWIYDASDNGISVVGGTGITISGNEIEYVGNDGIQTEESSDVEISGNWIDDAEGDGIDIDGGSNVTIENNDIDDVDGDGIDADDVNTLTIAANTINDTGENGISVDGGNFVLIDSNTVDNTDEDGIYVEDMDDENYDEEENLLPNVTISNNNIGTGEESYIDGDGIEVYGVVSSLITGNTVGSEDSYVDGDGILVTNEEEFDPAVITGNFIYNVDDNGIAVYGVDTVTISENVIDGTGDDGIVAEDNDTLFIFDNTINNADDNGIYSEYFLTAEIAGNTISNVGEDGIFADGYNDDDRGYSALISGNTINNAYGNGIVSGYTDDVTISGNTVTDVYGIGIDAYNAGFVDVNTNDILRTGNHGIQVSDSGYADITGNTVTDAGFGAGEENEDGYEADGIHVTDVYGYNNGAEEWVERDGPFVNISGNTVDTTADDGIEVVDSGTTVIDNNNVYSAGYGDGGFYGGGDEYGADGIHVRNVYNEEDGEGYAVTITNNLVDETGDDGIQTVDTDRTLISENDVTYAYDDGIDVEDSSHVEITGNYVAYSGDDGIDAEDIYGGDTLIIDGNEVHDSYDDGIDVEDVNTAFITNNKVYNNGDDGIDVDYANHVKITGNEVYNNGFMEDEYEYYYYYENDGNGIEVSNVGGLNTLIIDGNKVYDNQDDGIEVEDVNTAFITNNEVYNNGDDGIDVDEAYHVEIADNTVYDNGDDGIYVENVYGGETLIVSGNTVDNNDDDGIDIEDSDNVLIADNTVTNNSSDGVEIDDSDHIIIRNNTVADNGTEGIDVSDSWDNLLITGNTVQRNGGNGIEVDDATHVEIVDNTVSDNGENGIDVDGVYDEDTLIIANNLIENNVDNGIRVQNSVTTEIIDNVINNNGARGLFMQGPNNENIVLAGNVFTGNPVGARFESGVIDLTGDTNIFNFGDVALQFAPAEVVEYGIIAFDEFCFDQFCFEFPIIGPVGTGFADMSLVDDTLGAQFFNGQSTFFVELDNGAFFDPGQPTTLDALNSTYVTPFGTVTPSATGGFIGADAHAFLETRFQHFVDINTLGLFFFGDILSPEIDQEDIFNQFGAFDPFDGNINFTLNGLPFIDPAFALSIIAPAAGDDDNTGNTAEELAGLEPSAGGSGDADANCWADAIAAAESGVTVNYNFGGSLGEALADAAGCGAGTL